MSYILDALKRADSERERSGVPGLHAHAVGNSGDEQPRRDRLLWAAAAGVVLLVAVLAWWWFGARSTAPAAPVVPPNLSTAPVPPRVPVVQAPVMQAPAVQAPVSQLPAAPEPAARTPVVAPGPPPTVIVPKAPPAVVVAPSPPAVTATAASAARSDRVATLAELSPELRRQVPPLNVSGAVYSPQASARMVFIGGQVFREGDTLTEGLVLERIGPSSSVLSLRGTRFELKH